MLKSREEHLQPDIQQQVREYVLQDGDIKVKVIAEKLLDLRAKHKNTSRNGIVEFMGNLVGEQLDVRQEQEFVDLKKVFEKCRAQAKSTTTDRFVSGIGFKSGSLSRDRTLEGLIVIARALREESSTQNLANWMKEGHEGWVQGQSDERDSWERNRAGQIAAYWPGPVKERAHYAQSIEVMRRVQNEWTAWREQSWEGQGQYEQLHSWEEYGQGYYPTLVKKRAEWNAKQLDCLYEREEEVSKKSAEENNKGKGANTNDEPKNFVEEADARKLVFDRQRKFVDEYDYIHRMQATGEKLDRLIDRILSMHNENRENLVTMAGSGSYPEGDVVRRRTVMHVTFWTLLFSPFPHSSMRIQNLLQMAVKMVLILTSVRSVQYLLPLASPKTYHV